MKLGLAVSKGEKGGFTAKATVSDLEMPGEKMMLRFALAEERIRYTGGNGIRYHHMVVRSMPGGAKGVALPKKTPEQTVTHRPGRGAGGPDEVPRRLRQERRRRSRDPTARWR